MNIFLSFLIVIVFCIIGYIIGSFLFAPFIAKMWAKKDIRSAGSFNPGATNMWRAISKSAGFIVAILDAAKSYVAIILCWVIYIYTINFWYNALPSLYCLIFFGGLFAIIGHCFPVKFFLFFIKNKKFNIQYSGGKGISTFGGFLFAISPWIALSAFLFWLIIVLTTRYISIASIFMPIFSCCIIFCPYINWFYLFDNSIFHWINNDYNYYQIISISIVFLLLLLSSILIIFRHKKNIVRLINGKENKFF